MLNAAITLYNNSEKTFLSKKIMLGINMINRFSCRGLISLLIYFAIVISGFCHAQSNSCINYYTFDNDLTTPVTSYNDGWQRVNSSTFGQSFIAVKDIGICKFSIVVSGPSDVTFWWNSNKKSSKGFLLFQVDNNPNVRIYRGNDWEVVRYPIDSIGNHSLTWTFSKEFERDVYAWVDNLCIRQKPCEGECPDISPLIIPGCLINLNASANRSDAGVGDAIEYTIDILNKGSYLNNIKIYSEKINFSTSENNLNPNENKIYKTIYIVKKEDLPGPFEIIFHAIGKNAMCLSRSKSEVLVNLNCLLPANISVTKTTNFSGGCPSDRINFDINVTNTGKVFLDPVTIVDTLPDGLGYLDSIPVGKQDGQKITWNLEEPLLVGKSKNIKLIAQINDSASGILRNEVNATGQTPAGDNVTANNSSDVEVRESSDVEVRESCANISVTKTANPSSGCTPDVIAFDINVTNTGKVPLDLVKVADSLPEGMEYNNSTPAGISEGRNLTWNLNPLGVGKSDHIKIMARINQSSPDILTNLVKATGRSQNGTEVTANDSELVDVSCRANISVIKTSNLSRGSYQDRINFVINVTNTGKVSLDQVTVVDTLPDGLGYIDSIPAGKQDGQKITWNLKPLGAGQSDHVKLLAQIDQFSSSVLIDRVDAIGRPPTGYNVTANDIESLEVVGPVMLPNATGPPDANIVQLEKKLAGILNTTNSIEEKINQINVSPREIINVSSMDELKDAIKGTNRIIYLENNTYNGSIKINTSNIKLISRVKWGAKFDGNNSSCNINLSGVEDVLIQGLNLTNAFIGIDANESKKCRINGNLIFFKARGIVLDNCSDMYLGNNDIRFERFAEYDADARCIKLLGSENNHIIRNKLYMNLLYSSSDPDDGGRKYDILLDCSNRNVIIQKRPVMVMENGREYKIINDLTLTTLNSWMFYA